ncbi:hypothetical protein C8R48DRAFT_262597 [Suillus tomentosus]|nr:hypothetical protein C8R48DRAFT_262597 [Suillus tomentosus]
MPTLSDITEMASALVLQAPGTDAPLDVLGDWGREVARFLTWLDTEERKVLFTLTAVSQLHTTFQEQVDARLHYPWRSWGRQWLPLTAEAWEAKMQALMGSPVIGNPLASTQLSSLAIIALPDPSNEGKGGGRAGAGDWITDEKSTRHTRTSQAKRPREEALQGDISSDVQTPSSFADRPSNRPRLPPSVKKPLRRMPPFKPRSFNELMQNNNLRDPRVVRFLFLLNLFHTKLFPGRHRWYLNARDVNTNNPRRRGSASPYFVCVRRLTSTNYQIPACAAL